MAKYELPIYGENDELIKTYETNHIRWALFMKATSLQSELKGKDVSGQMESINAFVKEVFVGLTDDELMMADAFDVMNTFAQIANVGKQINTASIKNA